MSPRSGRAVVAGALVVGLLGAAAIMISPITPWATALAVSGTVLFLPSAVVLVVYLLRNW
jgi:hypothetical protein